MKTFALILIACSLCPPLISQNITGDHPLLGERITRAYQHWKQVEQRLIDQLDQLAQLSQTQKLSVGAQKNIRRWSKRVKFALDEKMLTQIDPSLTQQVDRYFPQLDLDQLPDHLLTVRMAQMRLCSYFKVKGEGGEVSITDSVKLRNAFKEVEFMAFQEGERVGEIGAGEGWLAVAIGVLYDSLEYYVNEIVPAKIQRIDKHLKQFLPPARHQHFHSVQGNVTSTGMEGRQLDVILIQNSFHHFFEKHAMLESIKASMKPEGRLILIEEFKAENPPHNTCSELMARPEFDQVMEENGWIRAREALLPEFNRVILEYQAAAF